MKILALLAEQVTNALGEKGATVATYGGGGTAFFGGITANWVAAIGGLLIGVAGLAMKWYFGREHLKLARERAGLPPTGEKE